MTNQLSQKLLIYYDVVDRYLNILVSNFYINDLQNLNSNIIKYNRKSNDVDVLNLLLIEKFSIEILTNFDDAIMFVNFNIELFVTNELKRNLAKFVSILIKFLIIELKIARRDFEYDTHLCATRKFHFYSFASRRRQKF